MSDVLDVLCAEAAARYGQHGAVVVSFERSTVRTGSQLRATVTVSNLVTLKGDGRRAFSVRRAGEALAKDLRGKR